MCNNIVKGDNLSYDHQGAAESSHDGYSQAESMAYNVSRNHIHLSSHNTLKSMMCVCIIIIELSRAV